MSEPTFMSKKSTMERVRAMLWLISGQDSAEQQRVACEMVMAGERDAFAAALSRAITLCEEVSERAWAAWKRDADMLAQGRSLGADECCEAIRRAMEKG